MWPWVSPTCPPDGYAERPPSLSFPQAGSLPARSTSTTKSTTCRWGTRTRRWSPWSALHRVQGREPIHLHFTGESAATADGTLPELRRVGTSLAKGSYRITVTVEDLRTGKSASRSRTFQIQDSWRGATMVPGHQVQPRLSETREPGELQVDALSGKASSRCIGKFSAYPKRGLQGLHDHAFCPMAAILSQEGVKTFFTL